MGVGQRNALAALGFEPWTAEPVASRYIDNAALAHSKVKPN